MTGEMKGGMTGGLKGEMRSSGCLYLKDFQSSDGRDGDYLQILGTYSSAEATYRKLSASYSREKVLRCSH